MVSLSENKNDVPNRISGFDDKGRTAGTGSNFDLETARLTRRMIISKD